MAKRRLGLFSWCGLGLSAIAASAQTPYYIPPKTPCYPTYQPYTQGMAPVAPQQQQPATPPQTAQQPATTPPLQTESAPSDPGAAPNLDLGGGLALGESTVALALPGYIDSAVIQDRVRLRYDAANNNPFPDRGELFYPKCGCFRNPAAGNQFDPNAKGPPLPESGVDSQDVELMVEKKIGCRASVFVEAPWRFINPEQNANENGFGDLRFGLRYGLIQSDRTHLTAQVRVGVPTGDGEKGLGNELTSYEPAILLSQQIGCRGFLYGEFRGWIPTNGSDFAANILRYGVGVGYMAVDRDSFSAQPILEVVGWRLLDGGKSRIDTPALDATGDNIVNVKGGIRFGLGEKLCSGMNRSSLYVGYGHNVTNERWYREIYRVEYQINF